MTYTIARRRKVAPRPRGMSGFIDDVFQSITGKSPEGECVAQANAESIQKVNAAIQSGGESYFRYRQIEMIPQIAPMIAEALSKARLVTISGDSAEGGAAHSATSNITSVIQTVLAAQLVSGSGMFAAYPYSIAT